MSAQADAKETGAFQGNCIVSWISAFTLDSALVEAYRVPAFVPSGFRPNSYSIASLFEAVHVIVLSHIQQKRVVHKVLAYYAY